ncbi:MAG: hypothetical protein WC840_01945 [Candidatus Peribacteraceae bacterium]
MDTLRRVSAFVFYCLGTVMIVLIVLVQRGIAAEELAPIPAVLDLPLLLTGVLFGGSSLYVSLVKDKRSIPLLIVIFLPLAALVGFFVYLNFSLPFTQV